MKATIEKLTIDNFELKKIYPFKLLTFVGFCDIIIVGKIAIKT
jgi:hypothetical protein